MRVLTFDIEDWFHILEHDETANTERWTGFESRVERGTRRLLDELERRGTRATFFCLGWVAEHHPEVVAAIDAAGHEIGTHSYAHGLVHQQDEASFEQDLVRSIDAIGAITGKAVTTYRAPGFSITRDTPWAFEILVRHGIEVDTSIFPASRAHGGFARAHRGPCTIETAAGTLKELPMTVGTVLGRDLVFSGGGYFRLLPYRAIEALASREPYLMTYFHPRDFDAEQPMIPGLSWPRRFKSYVGLAGAFAKLGRLLDAFDFVDVRTAAQGVDWGAVPQLDLEPARCTA